MKCDDCKYSDISRQELGRHGIFFNKIYCIKRQQTIIGTFFDKNEVIKCTDYKKELLGKE